MNKKPNVVFIFIDDMGYKDIACAGSEFYETDNIDKMGEDGIIFTNAYASCPVCSPSRASAMTGKYPAKVGVTDWIDEGGATHPCKGKLIDVPYIKHLPKEEKTIAHYLKDEGYKTWHIGKWHLGREEFYPDKFGFDVNIGGCSWGNPNKGYFSPFQIPTMEDHDGDYFLSDRLTDEAINLINENDGTPFYLNMWHYAVHAPIQAKPDDIKYFEEKAHKMGIDKINPIEIGEHFPTEHKKNERVERRIIQSDPAYAALVYNLDQNVGRLIKAVEEKGELENTLFIFTSDNGGLSTAEGSPTCNLPASEGKGWTKEGGLRVPMVCYWKGVIEKGLVCDDSVTTPDIFSTILDVCGGKPDDDSTDGVTLMPCFKNEHLEKRPIFWHYPHYGNQGSTPGSAVKYGDYKLIEFFEDERYEMYNIKEDIGEKFELSEKEPEIFEELKGLLKKWQDEIGALIPEKNPEYKA